MKISQVTLFFFLNFVLVLKSSSQGFNWSWAKGIGGYSYGTDIKCDANGNVYAFGDFVGPAVFDSITINPPGTNSNIFLVKYSSNGQVIWAKSAGNNSGECYSQSITIDEAGSIYVTGAFEDISTFDSITVTGSSVGLTFFLAKYDPNGNIIWVRTALSNYSIGISIASDNKANIYVTGWFQSKTISFDQITLTDSINAYPNFFVAKYDSAGSVLWAKNFGGNNSDYSMGISTDTVGNIYLTGNFDSNTLAFDSIVLSTAIGSNFLVKFNSNGTALWAKKTTGSGWVNDICNDLSGNIYITGYIDNTSLSFDSVTVVSMGYDDIFIAKFNRDGNILWAKCAGGISEEEGRAVVVDTLENVYITGYYLSDSVYFGTTVLRNDSAQWFYDVFVAVYDKDGNILGAKSANGIDEDRCFSVAVNTSGDIFLTGYYISNPFILGNLTLVSNPFNGIPNAFIAKLSALLVDNSFFSEQKKSFTVYPNPSSGLFNIFNNVEQKIIKTEVFNSLGESVFYREGKTDQINIANAPSGVYFCNILNEKGQVYWQKLIKN